MALLFDIDEHTTGFGGAKAYFEDADAARRVDGVMIGYPGLPATYREDIKSYFGKKYDKPPRSIADFS